MKERFNAGPDATLIVDESEREHWESFGLAGREAQDAVFKEMARAVAHLTASDDINWQPASALLLNPELHSTDT